MKSKKVKPLVILTIMVLVLVGIGTIFYARESSKSKLKSDQVNVSEKLKEKDDKEEAIKTEKVEDASSKTSDKLNDDKEDKTNTKDIIKEEKNTNNSNNNSNNNNSNNTSSKSSGGTNTSKNSDTTISSSNNNQSQSNNTQPSNNITTDPYNYITGGVIDAPTKESCLAKGDAILNKHLDELMDYNSMHMDNQKSQDITNLECYPVHKPDQDGWFLNILCNSGNCNSKYK